MLYLVVFFIVVAGFTAILYSVKAKAVAEYIRNDIDDNIALSFYTMNGIFKYKYEIPLVDLGRKSVKFKLVKEQGRKGKKVGESKGRLKLIEIFDKYVYAREYYLTNKDFVSDLKSYLSNKLVLAEFNLYISEGTGNACHTGIICGVLWSLAGLLTTSLSNTFTTLKKQVCIEPNFKEKAFIVDFYCIFHIKLVHIIVLLVKILFNQLKEKQKQGKEIGGGFSG